MRARVVVAHFEPQGAQAFAAAEIRGFLERTPAESAAARLRQQVKLVEQAEAAAEFEAEAEADDGR